MFYCDPGPTFIGNEISYNWALVYGGGIYFQFGGSSQIERCLFYGNNCEVGGGLAISAFRNIEIDNCTISDNIASVWGGGISTATFSYPLIQNTIVYGNVASDHLNLFTSADDSFNITYSDIEDGWYGTGNINADPLFTDPVSDDYTLSWLNYPLDDSTKSPCIDAGNPISPFDPDSTVTDIGYIHFEQTLETIQDLIISLADSSILLTWSTIPGATQYRIYASDTPYFIPLTDPIITIDAPDTTVIVPETGQSQMHFIVTSYK
jgi:hypothetical protein